MWDLEPVCGFPLSLDEAGRLSFGPAHGQAAPAPGARTLTEMRPFLRDPAAAGPAEVYWMYRDAALPEHRDACARLSARYDVTVLLPGTLGMEFIKTAGHYHPPMPGSDLTYGEVYQVLFGRAACLLQRAAAAAGDGAAAGRVVDAVLVEAEAGDLIVIPPGYGHVTVNVGRAPLAMANWVDPVFQAEYSPYREARGAAYYLLDGAGDGAAAEPNPRYRHPAPLRRAGSDIHVRGRGSMYRDCLDDPAPFLAWLRPGGCPVSTQIKK